VEAARTIFVAGAAFPIALLAYGTSVALYVSFLVVVVLPVVLTLIRGIHAFAGERR